MSNLQHRQQKIQEKRKQTSFRDFLMEIASWIPVSFSRTHGLVSRYPDSDRVSQLASMNEFFDVRQNDEKIYDPHRSFFDQLHAHFSGGVLPAVWHYLPCENAAYADTVGGVSNVYLSFLSSVECSSIYYSFVTRNNVHDVYNSMYVIDNSSAIYQSFAVSNSQDIFYSRFISNSSQLRVCINMIGCHNCIQCSGLVNKEYCINNKQYTRESYVLMKQEILRNKSDLINSFSELGNTGDNIGSYDVSGSYLVECNDITNGYVSAHIKTGKNVILSGGAHTCEYAYDSIQGIDYNHAYATAGIGMGDHFYCCVHLVGSYMFYSTLCRNCSYCLGCVGLNNKSFCIFNKQYTKEERHKKVDEIFTNMEKEGVLGEFFPGQMNPFYFNDTAAYLIDDSFSKEGVEAKGYLRRDEVVQVDIPEGVEVVKTSELGQYEGWKDEERHIDPSILNKVIKDEQGNVYKAVKMEYDFLMKHALPLPRKHWLDRLKMNFKIV